MDVVNVVHSLLDKFDTSEVYTGIIVSAIITQRPDITPEQLQAAVKSVTEFIALQVGVIGETVN